MPFYEFLLRDSAGSGGGDRLRCYPVQQVRDTRPAAPGNDGSAGLPIAHPPQCTSKKSTRPPTW